MDRSQIPEPMPKLINVMEFIVSAIADEVMAEEKMCNCAQCQLDVMALALNALPAKYVVTAEGKAYETYRIQGQIQSRIAVYQAVLQAAHMVKARPRHDKGRRFQD